MLNLYDNYFRCTIFLNFDFMQWKLFIIIPLLFAISACGSGDNNADSVAIPRRTAYPRLSLPKPDYLAVEGIDWHLLANSSATPILGSNEGNSWVTLNYTTLGEVSLMLTIIPAHASEIPDILDNRAERINLNLGGNPGKVWEVMDSTLSGEIIVNNSITTPVQLLVTDNRSVVLSGVAFIPALTPATRDSLNPIVDYLLNDAITLIQNFRHY